MLSLLQRIRVQTEHWRMVRLENPAIAEIHVDAARQAWIEAAHRTHDIDSLELGRAVFLEDRSILHCIFIRPRRAVRVAWIGIPGCRRIGMIVRDLVPADHHVMRKNPAYRFVEAAADGL